MIDGFITDRIETVDAVVMMNADNYHPSTTGGTRPAEPGGETFDIWIARLKDLVAIPASILVIAASVWWCVTFFTGGLKSQDQFAIQELSSRVSAMQVGVANLSAQITSMPRPSDYAALTDHLQSLDRENVALKDELTQARIELARISERIGGIPPTYPANPGKYRQ